MKYLSFFLLFLLACSNNPPGNVVQEQEIVLGASLPLTGEVAGWGIPLKAGIDIATKEINNQGGINGKKIRITFEDDRCGKDAVTIFNKLTSVDNVVGVIGPLCSAAAGPAIPIAQDEGVTTMLFASAPKLTLVGDAIFRIYPSDSFAGIYMAERAYSLGKRKAAVVYVQNDWGQGLRDTFTKHFEELGGEVILDESVDVDQRDTRTIVTKLQATDADIIIAPMYPAVGLVFVRQARELRIDIPILGGDGLDVNEFITDPATEGVQYVTASINSPEWLTATAKEQYNVEPHIGIALGYDSVYAFKHAIELAGSADRTAIKNAMPSVEFNGASNDVVAFDENGDQRWASYVVKTIHDGEALVAD